MNDHKLNQLIAGARQEAPPTPPSDFADGVMRALRNEPGASPGEISWPDALDAWFPRLAWGAALFIALCVGVEFGSGAFGLPTVDQGMDQLSQEWLFTVTGG